MKILASDLDGTLVINDEIGLEDLEKIKSLREKGHKFVVSTGRSLIAVKDLIDKYKLEYDYMVLSNGATILDGNGKELISKTIKKDILNKIIDEVYNDEEILVYFDNGEYIGLINNPQIDIEKTGFMSLVPARIIEKEELINMDFESTIIGVFAADGSYERAEKVKNKLVSIFKDEQAIYRNQHFVDIMAKGCSKGNGLKEILKIEKKDFKDLYTVGDSYNDISMFEITENSYTFNRAEEEIKNIAKNKIDYVYEIINKVI